MVPLLAWAPLLEEVAAHYQGRVYEPYHECPLESQLARVKVAGVPVWKPEYGWLLEWVFCREVP